MKANENSTKGTTVLNIRLLCLAITLLILMTNLIAWRWMMPFGIAIGGMLVLFILIDWLVMTFYWLKLKDVLQPNFKTVVDLYFSGNGWWRLKSLLKAEIKVKKSHLEYKRLCQEQAKFLLKHFPTSRPDFYRLLERDDLEGVERLLSEMKARFDRKARRVEDMWPRFAALGVDKDVFEKMLANGGIKATRKTLQQAEADLALLEEARKFHCDKQVFILYKRGKRDDMRKLVDKARSLLYQADRLGLVERIYPLLQSGNEKAIEDLIVSEEEHHNATAVISGFEERIVKLTEIRRDELMKDLSGLRSLRGKDFRKAGHQLRRRIEQAEAARRKK